MRNRGWAAPIIGLGGLSGLVLVLAACGSSATNTNPGAAYGGSSMSPAPSSSSMDGSGPGTTNGTATKTATLAIRATKIGKVLTDTKGDTLYWYAKDTKGSPSTCTGPCLAAWPAVTGKAVAAPGVKFAGVLGSVTDANGTVQATYNGYPLYTYKEDMAPGQTAGNGEGGVWHVITGTNLAAAASSGMGSSGSTKSSGSSGSSGSGYGSGYGSGTPVGSGSGSAGSSSSASSSSKSSDSSGSSSSRGSSSGSGPAKHTSPPAPPAPPSTPAAPAPAPTFSVNGGGCGSGSCW